MAGVSQCPRDKPRPLRVNPGVILTQPQGEPLTLTPVCWVTRVIRVTAHHAEPGHTVTHSDPAQTEQAMNEQSAAANILICRQL